MIKVQVTLFDKNGKYRPISTIVKEVESMEYYNTHKAEIQRRAIENICHQRRVSFAELKKQGYTLVKAREYDIEKIEQQKKQQHIINIIKKKQREREQSKATTTQQ